MKDGSVWGVIVFRQPESYNSRLKMGRVKYGCL